MKGVITERRIVVVLFVMVLVSFGLAQNETKKMGPIYYGLKKAGTALAHSEKSIPTKIIPGN